MEASLWTVICLQRFIHMTSCTNMPAKKYKRTLHCVYIFLYPNNYTHACGYKSTPVNHVYNTYSNNHKHALRCGFNCIFNLVTHKKLLIYTTLRLGKTFAGSSLPADVRSIRQYSIYSISQRDSLIYRCLYWDPPIRRIGGSQNKPK